MTTQPRAGIPTQGFPQSQSQPIPTGGRFGQPHFAPNQAYSPRHIGPSSSPLQQQQQYYQQAGGAHDMYKGQGISGTPPATGTMIMQPQQNFYPTNGAHRGPRGPPRFYYQQPMMQRYSNIQGPPTSPSYYSPAGQAQYPYMQASQIPQQQHQMYGSPYGAAAFNQPPPQQITPIQQPQPVMPQTSSQKRRKIITIKDPNTLQDLTEDILKSGGSRQDSLSTPPSGRSSATPPHSDIPAQFAAKVAAAVGTTKSMHETQLVGSPSLGGQMGTPTQSYMSMPTAPSPRPPSLPPQMMMQQPYGPHSTQILSSSPSYAVTPPQIPQATAYQLAPSSQSQQLGTSSMPITQQVQQVQQVRHITPNNTYSMLSRPTTAGEETTPKQGPAVHLLTHSTPAPMHPDAQAPVEISPQPPTIPQTEPLEISQQPQTIPQTEPIKTQSVITGAESTAAPRPQVAATAAVSVPVQKEKETVESTIISSDQKKLSDASQPQGGDSAAQVPPSVDIKTEEVAIAQSRSEKLTLAASASSKVGETQSDQVDARPTEPVPSEPAKPARAQEKEDTAVRLENETSPLSESPLPEIEPVKKEGAQNANVGETKPTLEDKKSADGTKMNVPEMVVDANKNSRQLVETSPTPVPIKREPSPPPPAENPPSVKVVPPTPPRANQQKAPVPSKEGPTAAKKPEAKPESAQTYTKGSAKAAEKHPSKPRVKSPEPPKAMTPEPKLGRPVRKDSASSDSNKQSKARPASQNHAETPVVNGVASEASPETDVSSKTAKKSDDVTTTPKTSKMVETKPTTEQGKPSQGKEASTPARTATVSSEKSANAQSAVSEKTNGIAPENTTKSAPGEKIKYDTDQWSPLNPTGKRQYDSNFLLKFQYKPTSLEKPRDLPDIDIVLEQPHKQVAAPMQPMATYGGSDFTPNYMRSTGPRRPNRQNSREHRTNIRSQMMGPNMSGQKVLKVVSIDRGVELKTTANAWKRIKRGENSTEESEVAEITREVRAILNKLTPSTFPQLMQQVLALKIDTEEKLRGTIDLIFEKAIDEPNFSEAYANMCRQMTSIRVTPEEATPPAEQPTAGSTVEFRKLLLTKCQREFEKNKSDQEHLQELRKKMEENKDEELAVSMKEEYEIAETKERRRTQGNIRFIGELFKLHMLTESIMHNCIMSLFKARDDEQLESLCRLLTTIGKDLDHQKGKQRMDQYFEQIMKIIHEKRTSSRVRFMLQDVHDLRLNNWKPRAIVAQGPKTISQIHQDAKEEQEMLQLKIATAPPVPQMKQGGRQSNRMGSRGHGGEDGWTKVQTPKPTRYDPNKMKLKPNQFDENKVTLGPSRGYMGWKSGSAGSGVSKTGSSGGYSPSASMDRTPETGRSNTPTMMNRFSALSQGQTTQSPDFDYQRRQGGRQSSREGSRTGSRGSMGPPSSSSSGSRTPRKDERTSVLEAARKLTSSDRSYETRQKSRESSPSVRPRQSTPQQPPAHKYDTSIDEEKMQQKSKNILEEFLSIVDFKEATECIEELNAPPSLMHSLVFIGHEFTLEKKCEARTNIGRLMAHLLKRGRLSVEQYTKGLAELLEMATDYEIDVPRVWEYLAEHLAPVFEDDKEADIPLTCLAQLAAPLREEGKSGVFVAEVVKAIIKNVPIQVFAPRWQKNNMLWKEIIGKGDEFVEDFLSQHKLEDLSDSKAQPDASGARGSAWIEKSGAADEQYRFEQEIAKLLESNSNNEDIFVWVEKNVERSEVIKPSFIRALTISVCKNAIDREKMHVNEGKISKRSILLKKFIETDPDRELQALYALQHLMVILEQPANVLRKFFDVLYNEDVISESSFYKWEKSDDPNEQEGRGVAVASVNMFFTWLRTAELESD